MGYSERKMFRSSYDATNLRKLGRTVLQHTSAHGIPNIFRSKHWFRRLVWLSFVTFALSCALWQCTEMVVTYYTYPSHEKIMLISSAKLKFPAVTICNLNSVRLSSIKKSFAMATTLQVGTSGKPPLVSLCVGPVLPLGKLGIHLLCSTTCSLDIVGWKSGYK